MRELTGGQVCGAVRRMDMSAVEATRSLPEGEAVPGAEYKEIPCQSLHSETLTEAFSATIRNPV